MNRHRHELVVDETASEQRIQWAVAALDRRDAVVVLDGVVALRPASGAIVCEVIDPVPDMHRCAEEFKVLLENAARAFGRSRLAGRLSGKPLRWVVVDGHGSAREQLWPPADRARVSPPPTQCRRRREA